MHKETVKVVCSDYQEAITHKTQGLHKHIADDAQHPLHEYGDMAQQSALAASPPSIICCTGGQSQLGSAGSSGLSDFLSGTGPQGSSPTAPGSRTDLLGRALSSNKQDSFDFIGVSKLTPPMVCMTRQLNTMGRLHVRTL